MEDQKVGGRHTTSKLILKEFQETNYKSFSDGQITISFPNEKDLTHVNVVLTPTGGPYAGATVAFTLRLPASYPNEIATVQCVSKILHPNISKTGAVCFNVFGGNNLLSPATTTSRGSLSIRFGHGVHTAEWDSCMRLVDYAHALLWLLYQPNLDSRLNSECPHNRHEFERLVRSAGLPPRAAATPRRLTRSLLPPRRSGK